MLDLASAVLSALSAAILAVSSTLMLAASLSGARPLDPEPGNPREYASVAVIVPVYREGPHVRYVLQSLKGVRYPRDRLTLVVVGEEGDDETYREISRLCETSEGYLDCGGVRGVYIINKSGARGKPAALNFALGRVDADVVAVYDAEDTVHPDHISIAVRLLEDESVGAVQFVREVSPYPGNLAESQRFDFHFYYMVFQPYLAHRTGLAEVCGSAFFMRLSLLKSLNGFNSSSPAEDLDLTYRLGARGLKVLVSLPPSFTRPVVRTSSLVKQRARWIRGGILSIPTGLRALPRSAPLLLVTGLMPLTSVVSTVAFLLLAVGLATGSASALSWSAAAVLAVVCSLGALPVVLAGRDGRGGLKYLAAMSPVYFLASWRAVFELAVSPRDWTKSESKA